MRRFLKGSPFAQPLALALAVALASLGAPRSARAQNVPQWEYGEIALVATTPTQIPPVAAGGMLSGTCAYEITNVTGAFLYVGFDNTVSNSHYGHLMPIGVSTFNITLTNQGAGPTLWVFSVSGTGSGKNIHFMAWC